MARPQEINEEQILNSAKSLIESDEFEKFSMRILADKCNIAASTLYLHFENKLEIVIAVVRKFWTECLKEINIVDCQNFFESLKKIYFHILEHLEKFKVSWLNSFSSMSMSDKNKGKHAMSGVVSKIQLKLECLLESYSNDFDSNFYKTTDTNYLSKFIFDNLMSMLMKCSHNYDSFEVILKRILLNQSNL